MSADRALIDTNVLVYAIDTTSPHYSAASVLLGALAAGRFVGCTTAQVLLEFVSVVTNPKRVTSARTPEEAWTVADSFAGALTMLPAPAELYARTSAMARSLKIARQDVFDLAIAITALESGVATIYSFDPSVFSKVPGIAVLEPATSGP